MSQGESSIYSGKCSCLSREETAARLAKGEKAVIRFRTPIKKVEFRDIVRGEMEFDSALFGDFVIAKSLEEALYNFVVVVDDAEMKITHVIRGEDQLSNTPKQILIQEALGIARPQYAHLPLIMGPDRSKLSKRHGAVAVTDYRKQGYLPETMVNFMAFLGWNPGTDREIYSLSALVKDFSLEKIQKGGAVFNTKRLDYLNGFYIRQYPLDSLAELCLPYLAEAGLIEIISEDLRSFVIKATGERTDFEFIKRVIFYHQQRLKKLSEISELASYFFVGKLNYEKDLLKWKDADKNDIAAALDETKNIFSNLEVGEWTRENLEKTVLGAAAGLAKKISKNEQDRGYLLWPLRASLCGMKMSIGPFEMAEVLGKEKTLKRVQDAIDLLNADA